MTEEFPTSKASRLEPLSVLWRILAAPQTLLVLMGLLALALMLGTLIPQIPSWAAGGPQAWLAAQPDMLRPRNDLIQALGLFDLYHTFLYRMLLVLIGLVLFVRAVDSADLAWRVTRRNGWTPGTLAPWLRHATRIHLSSSLSPANVQARIRDFLTSHGYWWTDMPAPPNPNLIAGRRGIALWARPLVCGALILALAGLAVVGNWGWQNEDWHPAPGESRAVGHANPYAVRLDTFHMQLGNDGHLRDYRSDITWLEGDVAIEQDVAGIGKPAVLRGIAARQVGYLPILKVQSWDATGRPLAMQAAGVEPGPGGELEIRFPSAQTQLYVFIPQRNLFLALAFQPLCDRGKPALYLALIRGGRMEQQSPKILYESGVVHFDDVRVNVDLAYGPVLRVDYRPAMGFVIGSMAIAVAALAAGWIVSPRLMWIAAEPDREGAGVIQILAMPGTRGSLWLRRLASRLQKVLADET